jgi:hypothetical protein
MELDPGEVLNEARAVFRDGDYEKSLEKYQWFFDNSIKIKRSYYGVRLSYCLAEWAKLGKSYLPATEALIKEKQKALTNFQNTLSFQDFHDYSSVSRCLSQDEEVLQKFLLLHESNKDLAKRLFTFVYEYCASLQMWDICREYLGNGYKQYEYSLETFDYLMEFAEKKKGDGGESIYQDAVETMKRESLWLLNMLHSINAPEEYNSVMSRLESDLKARGFEQIFEQILEKAPNKALQRTSW